MTPKKGGFEIASDKPEDSVAFFDLAADPAIFTGDANVDYQYEVYRQMRSVMLDNDPNLATAGAGTEREEQVSSKTDKTVWREYRPLTNVVWLSFILKSLLKNLGSAWPSTDDGMARTLGYVSHDLQTAPGDVAVVESKALRIEQRLKALEEILAVRGLGKMAETGLLSAGDLVWLATELKWLSRKDVLQIDER